MFVPERSPREMKGAALALIVCNAVKISLPLIPPDPGRIAFGADQDKIVVHHGIAFDAISLRQEFFLSRFGVYEHNVCIATPRCIEGLARALRDNFHLNAGLLLDDWQQVAVQARVLR